MPNCRLSSLLSVAEPIFARPSTRARGGHEMSLICGTGPKFIFCGARKSRSDFPIIETVNRVAAQVVGVHRDPEPRLAVEPETAAPFVERLLDEPIAGTEIVVTRFDSLEVRHGHHDMSPATTLMGP